MGSEISSCYIAKDKIKDMSSKEEKYEIATSIFEVKDIEKDRIEFYLNSYGANFSKCSAPGFAQKVSDNTYIFIDKKEYHSQKGFELYAPLPESATDEERCILTINFNKNTVSVKETQYRCNNFCGNHGDFNRTYTATNNHTACNNEH